MGGSKPKRGEPGPRRPERSAGAFINPDGIGGGIGVPMGTLLDEYHDEPAEPEEEHEPEPEPLGLIHRVVEKLARRPDRGR